MNTPTSGRVAKLATRVRTATRTHPGADLGPKALRLVLRELLHDGHGVPDWQHFAACSAPSVDRDLFYPPDGWAGDLVGTAAKRICDGCPVRSRCLADAITWEDPHQRHGVLGGLTATERTALAPRAGGEAA